MGEGTSASDGAVTGAAASPMEGGIPVPNGGGGSVGAPARGVGVDSSFRAFGSDGIAAGASGAGDTPPTTGASGCAAEASIDQLAGVVGAAASPAGAMSVVGLYSGTAGAAGGSTTAEGPDVVGSEAGADGHADAVSVEEAVVSDVLSGVKPGVASVALDDALASV